VEPSRNCNLARATYQHVWARNAEGGQNKRYQLRR